MTVDGGGGGSEWAAWMGGWVDVASSRGAISVAIWSTGSQTESWITLKLPETAPLSKGGGGGGSTASCSVCAWASVARRSSPGT